MKTVQKPWGHEEIWAITDRYVGKTLYINPGHRLSRQYHRVKMETIRVLSGQLLLETETTPGVYTTQTLPPGSVFHVNPGVIHRFGADDVSVTLVEVSTPELDDVVRLEDDYARNE
jgi:quercetin dioxygenase-like cupin family protein